MKKQSVRKIGQSFRLTVPASTADAQFILGTKSTGMFNYQPVSPDDNPWTNGEYAQIDFQKALAADGNYGLETAVASERVDW